MSNRSRENDYGSIPSALDFWLEQRLKDIHTARPGLIVEYDAPTKRARVLAIPRILMTDGSERRPPPIVDVPVVHPGGGGFVVHLPMKRDDKVLLVFSERGITEFKRSWRDSPPDRDALFELRDAMAIPMGHDREITIVDPDAVTMQTETGTDYVALKPNDIRASINGGTDSLSITPGAIRMETTGTITLASGGDTLVVR